MSPILSDWILSGSYEILGVKLNTYDIFLAEKALS